MHHVLGCFQYVAFVTKPLYLRCQQVHEKQHGNGQGFNFVPVFVNMDNAATFVVELSTTEMEFSPLTLINCVMVVNRTHSINWLPLAHLGT